MCIRDRFIPKTYKASVVDEIIQVQNDDAIRTSRELAKQEGLLVGISSGAAVYAATELAKRPEKMCIRDSDHNVSSKTSDKMEEIFFKSVDFLTTYMK